MRVVARIGALVLVAIGVAGFTAGSVGAVRSREPNPPTTSTRTTQIPALVKVQFEVRGDLAFVDGRLHDSHCVQGVQPNPFRIPPNAAFVVRVETKPFCDVNEAIWLLTTQPKPAKDPPETMGVRLRYGSRETQVAFLHPSKDLRWSAHVLGPDFVVVEITGK